MKTHATLLAFSLFLIFSLLSCSNEESPTTTFAGRTLVLGHSLPVTHPVHMGMADFATMVEEFSEGNLRVKIYPDAQLGSERESLELLQIGTIDMTKVSAAVMANFSPAYKVLGLPYIFRDEAHRFEVFSGPIGRQLLEGGKEYWLRGLTFYDAGTRSFYLKEKKVETPTDLEGLKIRVMNDPTSIDLVNALGGSATPMAFGELYTGLQQGVVDGAENNPPSFIASRHFEVCSYYVLDHHSAVPDLLAIGTKTWDTFSDQQKQWVQAAADSSFQNQKQYWAASVKECMEVLEEQGVEVIEPEFALFFEATEEVRQKAADDPIMADLIQQIQSIP